MTTLKGFTDMSENSNMTSLFGDDNKSQEDMDREYIVNMFLASISACMLFLMMYIGYRVYRIVKFNDKIILSMIFFLNLECLSLAIFYFINGTEDKDDTFNKEHKPYIVTIAIVLPVVWMSIAITINLRNW